MPGKLTRNLQYYKFCLYGFFKNLRLFDAFLILFLLENDMTFVQIGVLYSIREIVLAITEIPSGVIADAFGRKKTLISSFFFYILSFVIFYLAHDFYWFIIAMLTFAIGDAFRTGVHKAMIYHYLKENGWSNQKVNYYGHTRSWSQFGSAISALMAAAVVFYSGSLRLIFLISIFPYLIDALLIISYPNYLDGKKVTFNTSSIATAFKDVSMAFLQSFKRMYFIKALSSSSLYTGYYRAVKDYIQPLLKLFALSLPILAWLEGEQKIAIVVGVIYFISFLINAIASRYSGKIASAYPNIAIPLNLTIAVGFILGILTGILFHYSFFAVSIVCFISVLAIENLRKPMGVALIADLSKDKALATVLSASSQAKSIIAAILAPVIGYVADAYDPGVAIAVVTALLILLTPLYWLKSNPVK
jgi:MFS family permease